VAYATLQDVKAELRLAESDVDDDARLERCLAAASDMIDGRCGRRFELDATPSPRRYPAGAFVPVDDIGDPAVTAAVDVDADGVFELAVSDLVVEPANATAKGRPITRVSRRTQAFDGEVQVTARWGWPAVPAAIRQATILQAVRLFKRSDAQSSDLGQAPMAMGHDVWKLCAPFRREVIA
jgi:hypothetical protein